MDTHSVRSHKLLKMFVLFWKTSWLKFNYVLTASIRFSWKELKIQFKTWCPGVYRFFSSVEVPSMGFFSTVIYFLLTNQTIPDGKAQ